MSTHAVQVSNISPATTKEHLEDFFSFCGRIASIEYTESSNIATIHFEKPSAAKTALMLNGGTLDNSHLTVTSEVEHVDEKVTTHDGKYEQSDKPRAGIAAEYLARGYTLSDQILQRAIEIDRQQGISSRFLSYIQSLDAKLGARALGPEQTISGKVQETLAHATQQARAVDEQKGITKQAGDYYARALAMPLGQKVKEFYTTTSKQIYDIHEEARRIADTHKAAEVGAPTAASTGPTAPAPSSGSAGTSGAEVDTKTKDPSTVA
ncbi:hypothetical protein BKA93DRAFT_752959 [Sparassis latifolia]